MNSVRAERTSFFQTSVMQILLLLFSSFWINLLDLSIPIILMQVYDRIIAYQNQSTLIVLCVSGVLAICVASILKFLKMLITQRIGSASEYELTLDILKSYLVAKKEDKNKVTQYGLIEVIRSVGEIRNFKISDQLQTIFDLPFLIIYLLALYYIDFKIAVFNFAVISISIFVMYIVSRSNVLGSKLLSELRDQEYNFLTEIIHKIFVVKSVSFEKRLLKEYQDYKSKGQTLQYREKFLGFCVSSFVQILSNVCLLGTVMVGASSVTKGGMTVGGLTAATLISGRLMQPVFGLIRLWVKISEIRKKESDIHKVLGYEAEDLKGDIPKELSASAVSFFNFSVMEEDKLYFENLNFDFDEKKTYYMNGLDQSRTQELFSAICAENNEAQGDVYVYGVPVREISKEYLRSKVLKISNNGHFFRGTVIDNITLFSEEKSLGQICASLVGLNGYFSELKDGYQTLLSPDTLEGIPVSILQRIQLARVLFFKPKILLIDNIDQQMDYITRQVFIDILIRLRPHMTIILSSQQVYPKDTFDYEVLLHNNKLKFAV